MIFLVCDAGVVEGTDCTCPTLEGLCTVGSTCTLVDGSTPATCTPRGIFYVFKKCN